MGYPKTSERKSCSPAAYAALFEVLYLDVVDLLDHASVESKLDLMKIRKRIEAEGFSFLTKTLPKAGKHFDKCLQASTYSQIQGWETIRGSALPKMFGWLLLRVFDAKGNLLEKPCVKTIKHLRSLYYFMYKLQMPIVDVDAQRVISEFIDTDVALEAISIPNETTTTVQAQRIATNLFGCFNSADIMPKHGPGAVSTGEKCYQKHKFSRIYRRLERRYPFTEYFVLSQTQVCDEYHTYDRLIPLESGTAKVVLVPKDSRGPRLISCEPLEYQWIQQGLGTKFRDRVENHPLTRGHVNFTDQSINRRLALAGSKDQQWVTLDMKEASDRVSVELVNTIFNHCPDLLEALYACRSDATKLPDGTVHELRKFAPMGSNLCFPVEAFIFYALAVGAIMQVYNVPRRIARAAVYVYGDDIIVSSKYYAALLQELPKYGLMFNLDKCCVSGFFRESCGCDAFQGVDVTPLRLKQTWSHHDRVDARTIASYVGLSNRAYEFGYHRLAEHIRQLVERQIGPIPTVTKVTGGLAWVRKQGGWRGRSQSNVPTRFNRALQRMEALSYRIDPLRKKVKADDWSTVLRRITCGSGAEPPGIYAMPRRISLKRGWIAIE